MISHLCQSARYWVSIAVHGIWAVSVASCALDEIPSLTQPRDGKPLNGKVAVVYSENYGIHLGGLERLHPFDIRKYRRIYEALENQGVLSAADVYVPAELAPRQIRMVHTAKFVESLKDPAQVAGYLEAPATKMLPRRVLENGVLRPFRTASGGTILAAREALKYGVGINLGGGYHHAKPDHGEGFCIYADIPIAIRVLREEKKIGRVLVVDLDVHQGNGTIVCTKDDPQTYTFSIHQRGIYPIPKEKGDRDVEIPPGTTDLEYLAILKRELPKALTKSRPKVVFVVAGCDTLRGDPLASVFMTPEGVVQRDLYVVDTCLRRKIPVVFTLGGGYSKDAWKTQLKSVKSIIERGER
jgi:histone deacetylase 11